MIKLFFNFHVPSFFCFKINTFNDEFRLPTDKTNFWQTKIHKRTLNPSELKYVTVYLLLCSAIVIDINLTSVIRIFFHNFLSYIFPLFLEQFSMKILYLKSSQRLLVDEPSKFYSTILIHIHGIFVSVARKLTWANWI